MITLLLHSGALALGWTAKHDVVLGRKRPPRLLARIRRRIRIDIAVVSQATVTRRRPEIDTNLARDEQAPGAHPSCQEHKSQATSDRTRFATGSRRGPRADRQAGVPTQRPRNAPFTFGGWSAAVWSRPTW